MLVVNDIHIGFRRVGGTTPASQEALRDYLLKSFKHLLHATPETHLLINGDLFDDFEVAPRDWIDTYLILAGWIARGNRLTLVAGNHDHSPRAGKVSSFEMLCQVLGSSHRDNVTVVGIDQFAEVAPNIYALAHCSNQDVFNLKLDEILKVVKTDSSVLLHANFDNNFAAQADHSLNVSREQAARFIEQGATLYFAHEHQARTVMDDRVVVFGNQWPTSVSDCLNNDDKYAHVFGEFGVNAVRTWSRGDTAGFAEIDWRLLGEATTWVGFVRIVGHASAAEASEVVNAIAKFRQGSDAYVITNAVKVDGIVEAQDLPASFESTKRFDVMDYIKDHLDEEELKVIESLNVE